MFPVAGGHFSPSSSSSSPSSSSPSPSPSPSPSSPSPPSPFLLFSFCFSLNSKTQHRAQPARTSSAALAFPFHDWGPTATEGYASWRQVWCILYAVPVLNAVAALELARIWDNRVKNVRLPSLSLLFPLPPPPCMGPVCIVPVCPVYIVNPPRVSRVFFLLLPVPCPPAVSLLRR
eukprot:3337044-Rhodomonas_salina.1